MLLDKTPGPDERLVKLLLLGPDGVVIIIIIINFNLKSFNCRKLLDIQSLISSRGELKDDTDVTGTHTCVLSA